MKNPMPINLWATADVEQRGWIAEVRDMDGHLVSVLAWDDDDTTNGNLQSVADFIDAYEPAHTVQVFPRTIATKMGVGIGTEANGQRTNEP